MNSNSMNQSLLTNLGIRKHQNLQSSLLEKNQIFDIDGKESVLLSASKKKEEKIKRKRQDSHLLQNEQWLHQQLSKDPEFLEAQSKKFQYDTNHQTYSKEGFSYQSNLFIRRIASDRGAAEIACKYPLYKMLRAIAKKFFFNELEIIFLGYILEENKWAINDEQLKNHSDSFVDFLGITEIKEPTEYKRVLLYLILSSYAVKYYLNPPEDIEIFGQHLDQIIGNNFKELFQYWGKKYATNALRINPKKLNAIFRKLSQKPMESSKKGQEDYNALVDQIISISPPYTVDKQEEIQNKKQLKTLKEEQQQQGLLSNNNGFGQSLYGPSLAKPNASLFNQDSKNKQTQLSQKSIRVQDIFPNTSTQISGQTVEDLEKWQSMLIKEQQNILSQSFGHNTNFLNMSIDQQKNLLLASLNFGNKIDNLSSLFLQNQEDPLDFYKSQQLEQLLQSRQVNRTWQSLQKSIANPNFGKNWQIEKSDRKQDNVTSQQNVINIEDSQEVGNNFNNQNSLSRRQNINSFSTSMFLDPQNNSLNKESLNINNLSTNMRSLYPRNNNTQKPEKNEKSETDKNDNEQQSLNNL